MSTGDPQGLLPRSRIRAHVAHVGLFQLLVLSRQLISSRLTNPLNFQLSKSLIAPTRTRTRAVQAVFPIRRLTICGIMVFRLRPHTHTLVETLALVLMSPATISSS